MRRLTDNHIQTIVNALSNSRNDCMKSAEEARQRGGFDDENLFRQSAWRYYDVLELIENADNVAINVREKFSI